MPILYPAGERCVKCGNPLNIYHSLNICLACQERGLLGNQRVSQGSSETQRWFCRFCRMPFSSSTEFSRHAMGCRPMEVKGVSI